MGDVMMTDARKLIGSVYCKQYKTDANFYIDEAHPSGQRHLVVQYEKGGYQGDPEFAAAIPDDWNEEELHNLMLEPMNPKAPYPAWEVPARAFGSDTLFRWWAGEKPQ
jgi:hypothetical protein